MQSEPQAAKHAILEVALQLASRRSWDELHLYEVAREMGMGLADIQRHYGDKDEIADAWFDVADAALLRLAHTPGWQQFPQRDRLQLAYAAWLEALAPHRRITREMLGYKLQPEHVHLQVRGVMRVSRTVQWIREAALLPEVGWRRELAEAVLTSIFLTVFTHWLFDESPGGRRTQRLLGTLLTAAHTAGSLRMPVGWGRLLSPLKLR
jgi:ubiquinone biosynthesis protein COQ9